MSCYFVAQIKIHDAEEYQKYLDTCDEVFDKFLKFRLNASSSEAILVEGIDS